jgi:hypothetical protein
MVFHTLLALCIASILCDCNSKEKPSSQVSASAPEEKRPVEAGEGVPGYITDDADNLILSDDQFVTIDVP